MGWVRGAVDSRLRSQRSAPRVSVGVALSTEYAERLEEIAARRGLRLGQLVSEIAVEWLERWERWESVG